MRYPVFIKELSHFRRNHVSIVGHRDEGYFLAGLRCRISGRKRRFRGIGVLCVGHNTVSIHETLVIKAIQTLPKRNVLETGFGMWCR